RPLTEEEQARQTAKFFNLVTHGLGNRNTNLPEFAVENFQKTGGGVEPWEGSFRFDFVARLPEGADPAKSRESGLGKDQLRRFLRDRFQTRHETVEVETADTTDPRVVRYPVRIEGSR